MLQVGLLLLSCGLCQHVHKRLRRVYPHQPRSRILRCNRDYRHAIACVPISNASIYRSSRLMEDPTRNPLLCCSHKTVLLWIHQMQNVQARRLTNRGRSQRISPSFVERTPMIHVGRRGSSRTQRHSTPLSDLLVRFDGSVTGSMANPPMTRLSLRSRRV